MQPVIELAKQLAYQLMVGQQVNKAMGFGSMVFLGIMFTAGCLFLVFAFFIWLSTLMPVAAAALYTGLALIGMTGLFFFYKSLKARQEIRALEQRHRELVATAESLLQDSAAVTHEIESFAYHSPKESLLLASLAGFFFSDVIRR